ncbi:MAG: hypothetical protein IPK65_12855 [Gammaproteobacteria bacterium]|nr:hypothetical protein [Gammaproteobacteria bacterium]
MQDITTVSTDRGVRRLRPINEIVTEQLDLLSAVAGQLMQEGHTLIGVSIEPTGGLPTIQLAASARLSEMVAGDHATYYKRVTGPSGTHRTGQFQRGGVRVLWLELDGRFDGH